MKMNDYNRKRIAPFAHARRAFTLVEILIALSIFGLVMTAVATQLIESVAISLKTSTSLEHSRNTRELIDELRQDVANAQVMELYPQFNDRGARRSDQQLGNYLVLHRLTPTGVVLQTVGYYVVADAVQLIRQ